MFASSQSTITRRVVGNVWLVHADRDSRELLADISPRQIDYEVLETEEAVGRAMLEEIEQAAQAEEGIWSLSSLAGAVRKRCTGNCTKRHGQTRKLSPPAYRRNLE